MAAYALEWNAAHELLLLLFFFVGIVTVVSLLMRFVYWVAAIGGALVQRMKERGRAHDEAMALSLARIADVLEEQLKTRRI